MIIRHFALASALAFSLWGLAQAEAQTPVNIALHRDGVLLDGGMHHGAKDRPHGAGKVTVDGVTLPGQGAFGAIQDVVDSLEADPDTDWSKVNVEALRQHLIDMNDVTLKAKVSTTLIEGGARFTVTGKGRVAQAITRMVLIHAPMVNGLHGWEVEAHALTDGAVMTVTATTQRESAHIRGLGFMGIMVQGERDPMQNMAIARGEETAGLDMEPHSGEEDRSLKALKSKIFSVISQVSKKLSDLLGGFYLFYGDSHGLSFLSLASSMESSGSNRVLVVRGFICNQSDIYRKAGPILLSIGDRYLNTIDQSLTPPPRLILAPGDKVPFTVRMVNPSPRAVNFRVSFGGKE